MVIPKKERASPIVFNPCTRVREHGAPVQGATLGNLALGSFAGQKVSGCPLGFAVSHIWRKVSARYGAPGSRLAGKKWREKRDKRDKPPATHFWANKRWREKRDKRDKPPATRFWANKNGEKSEISEISPTPRVHRLLQLCWCFVPGQLPREWRAGRRFVRCRQRVLRARPVVRGRHRCVRDRRGQRRAG